MGSARSRWWRLLVAVLSLALAAGCTQQVAGNPTADPRASAPETTPSTSPELSDFAGRWEGTYTCAMGDAGLRLIIEEPQGDAAQAVFEFFPLPGNPGVPPGSFRTTGRIEGGVVVFQAGDWIVQPPGYVTVDLVVSRPPTGGADDFGGTVDDPECALFEVSRV